MSPGVSYVVDAAIWFALVVLTYAAVRYASSRLFPRADSHRLAGVLVTLGLAIGALWPFSALHGPIRLPSAGASGRPSIGDTIANGPCEGTITGPGTGAVDAFSVDAKNGLAASGWAVAARNGSVTNAVCAVVDDTLISSGVQYGGARPDVASALDNQGYANSGYSIAIPAKDLTSGPHTLIVLATSNKLVTIVATRDFTVP